MRDMAIKEKGSLLSCAGRSGVDEKGLKIISSQKTHRRECKRKEEMEIYCTVLGKLMVRTRPGMYLRSYRFKKRSTVQYMGSHAGEIAKQLQKQDRVQEANPPQPSSPVTVHMKQVCRIKLQYANSDTVQKKEQKPRQGMRHRDVISPSLIPAAFPRPSLPCSILCFWILHHPFLFSWARRSSRR